VILLEFIAHDDDLSLNTFTRKYDSDICDCIISSSCLSENAILCHMLNMYNRHC